MGTGIESKYRAGWIGRKDLQVGTAICPGDPSPTLSLVCWINYIALSKNTRHHLSRQEFPDPRLIARGPDSLPWRICDARDLKMDCSCL